MRFLRMAVMAMVSGATMANTGCPDDEDRSKAEEPAPTPEAQQPNTVPPPASPNVVAPRPIELRQDIRHK